MNTTVQALQALYVKLGGSLTDTYPAIADGAEVGNYTTIPDMIEACTQKAGSGGSSLPTVTSDDNGSVLTVVEGEWDKANAPTELPTVTAADNGNVLTVVEGSWAKAAPSSNVEVIGVTIEGSTVSTVLTASQIAALYAAGKVVVISADMTAANQGVQLIYCGIVDITDATPYMSAFTADSTGTFSGIVFTATTANDPFTYTIGG